ncbi:MAG: hypothetical protein AB8U25_03205 [Rickettsiales endosymbiont of Dermacentor nuttalli]
MIQKIEKPFVKFYTIKRVSDNVVNYEAIKILKLENILKTFEFAYVVVLHSTIIL